MMLSKRWAWILFIVAIVEIVFLFYINHQLYAGVINMGIFVIVLLFQMALAVIRKTNNRRASYAMISIPVLIAGLFLFYQPALTLQDAKQIISEQVAEQKIEFKILELTSDRNTVPVTDGSSWYRFYYVAVKKKDRGTDYFMVDPETGRVVEVDGPYW